MAAATKPPAAASSAVAWLREDLFGSPSNTLLTLVFGLSILWLGFGLVRWVLFASHWERIWVNLNLFAVFRYPTELLWRPLLAVAMIMALLGTSAGVARKAEGRIISGVFWWVATLIFFLTAVALVFWESVRWWWLLVSTLTLLGYLLGRWRPGIVRALPWAWALSLLVGIFLLYGVTPADGPLRVVQAKEWGGFLLSFILFTALIPSFPLGVALALGRRSDLPAIRWFCIGFIEIVRGAPLIMWLFIASILLPLILNTDPNNLPPVLRAYVAIMLFSAAYMAENVRGGLQAVPRGQVEAARALGLSGWQSMRLIVLPQALRAVIPAIVGQAIALFKDTSLVFVVGLFDFFNIANVVANQPESLTIPGGIRLELSLFLAVGYWFFTYRMSVASRQLEKQLGVGER